MNKAWLLATLLLAGCATPPPQVLAPEIVPKNFTGPIQADAKVWPDSGWWQGFGDSHLTALVEQAQSGNRDIAIAAARVMQAEAQSTIQRSALFPQIGGQGSAEDGGCKASPAGSSWVARISASASMPAMNWISGAWRGTICAPPMSSSRPRVSRNSPWH